MAEKDEILKLLEAAKPGEKIVLPDGTAYVVENGVVVLVGP